ncbi:MAG: hypothetical protein WBC20_04680, partial [Candidatus Aminicenantaceae bacterium]
NNFLRHPLSSSHKYAKRTLIDFCKTGNYCFAQIGNYRIAATIEIKELSFSSMRLPLYSRKNITNCGFDESNPYTGYLSVSNLFNRGGFDKSNPYN